MKDTVFQSDDPGESNHPDGSHLTVTQKFQHFIGRFRIRSVLTVSMVLILVFAMGMTSLFAFLNSQYAVSDLSGQLQNEVSDRIERHLDSYLETPHLINQLCLDSIRSGEINIHDNEGLKRHFMDLSDRFDTVEAICYGNELEGNYTIISKVGAPGVANGTDRFWGFSQESTNFSFEEYRIDRDGRIIEKTLSKPHYDPRTRPWYTSAVQDMGPAWTPVYMWVEGVVSQDAVLPVYSKEGRVLGVLDTSLTLTGIGDFLQSLNISKNGHAFIIEKSGLIVASSTIKEPYKRENDELIRLSALNCNDSVVQATTRYIVNQLNTTENINTRQRFDIDIGGVRQFVQVTPYQDNYGLDWLIIVVIPETDFMEKVNANNTTTIFLIFFSIIGTIGLCILLARWITEPLVSMNRSAKALAHGDWTSWRELDRRDELGELSHSFKQMSDQLQKTFSSLKSSEERYLSLFQSSADAILLFDGLTLLNINRAGEEMFGMPGPEAIGKDVRGQFGEVGCEIGEMIESSVKLENGGYLERTISRDRRGEEQFMNIRLTQVPTGESFLSLVHIRDITDQRRAIILSAEQEALRESYAKIEMILQRLPDPTFVVDHNGFVLFWNQALEIMTGVKAEEIIGKGDYRYSEAIHDVKRPVLIDIALHPEIPSEGLYSYIERSGDLLKTSIWVDKVGERRFWSVIAARLYDKNGNITGAIESIRDITSHKMAEEALIIANKKLNLLSSITRHDIMNKIMISKGHLFLLEEHTMDQEQTDSIAAIKRSLFEIEHFIEFTRTYQELGLRIPVWQDVREMFNRAAAGVDTGNVTIHNEIQGVSILVDPLFEKVCYNLIENAIRHGEYLTRIDITYHDTDEGIRISVEDDGCGVPDDLKEMIFERGFGKNTGFGLFLAREILSISEITIIETGQYGTSCRFDIDVPKGKFQKEG